MKSFYQPVYKYTFKYASFEDILTLHSSSIFETREAALSWAQTSWDEIKGEDDILIDITIVQLFAHQL